MYGLFHVKNYCKQKKKKIALKILLKIAKEKQIIQCGFPSFVPFLQLTSSSVVH